MFEIRVGRTGMFWHLRRCNKIQSGHPFDLVSGCDMGAMKRNFERIISKFLSAFPGCDGNCLGAQKKWLTIVLELGSRALEIFWSCKEFDEPPPPVLFLSQFS